MVVFVVVFEVVPFTPVVESCGFVPAEDLLLPDWEVLIPELDPGCVLVGEAEPAGVWLVTGGFVIAPLGLVVDEGLPACWASSVPDCMEVEDLPVVELLLVAELESVWADALPGVAALCCAAIAIKCGMSGLCEFCGDCCPLPS